MNRGRSLGSKSGSNIGLTEARQNMKNRGVDKMIKNPMKNSASVSRCSLGIQGVINRQVKLSE